jgi:hypothetical protein
MLNAEARIIAWQDIFSDIDHNVVMASAKAYIKAGSTFPPSAGDIYKPIAEKLKTCRQYLIKDAFADLLFQMCEQCTIDEVGTDTLYPRLPFAVTQVISRDALDALRRTHHKKSSELFRYAYDVYPEYEAAAKRLQIEMYVNGRSLEEIKQRILPSAGETRSLE